MGTTFSIKGKTDRFFITLASLIAVFVLAFISAFMISSVFAPVNSSDAESVTVSIANTGYYVTVTASDLDLTLDATPDGAIAVAKDTVNTKTNCNGYQLYLSSATTDPTVPIMNPTTQTVENVSTNSLILEGSDQTSGDWLPATSGRALASDGGPQAFKDNTNTNMNTWGFAIPSGSTGLPTGIGAFDASYGTTAESTADPANKFAAVPLYTAPQLIQETTTPNTSTGVDLDVYYGVYANMTKTAGDYSNNVLYTVLAKDTSVAASVSPSTITALNGSQSLTITTPIFTSMPLTSSDITATVDGTSCPVTAITTTDANDEPDVLKVTCTAPNLNVGTYDVAIDITKLGQTFPSAGDTLQVAYSLGGTTITSVSPNAMAVGDASTLDSDIAINTTITATGLTASDLTVKIGNITIPTSAISLSNAGTALTVTIDKDDATVLSALNGLAPGSYSVSIAAKGQTLSLADAFSVKTPPAFYTITTMQEMTPEICNNTDLIAPSKTAFGTVGTNYIPIAPASDGISGSVEYGSRNTAEDGGKNVPMRKLIDYRGKDGTGTSANPVLTGSNVQYYLVAKLADGNCWMTEHLQLPLSTSAAVEASYGTTTAGSISTFNFTPTSNSSIGTNTRQKTDGDTGTGSSGWKGYYYYNWLAATAEKGTSSTDSNVDVNGSICPKGWRLPANYTYSTTLSWGALTGAYLNITTNTSTSTGYQTLEAAPLSLRRSGYYNSGTFITGGSYGFYWSSTALSTSHAYSLRYGTSYVDPQNNNNKSTIGFSVRCLAVR